MRELVTLILFLNLGLQDGLIAIQNDYILIGWIKVERRNQGNFTKLWTKGALAESIHASAFNSKQELIGLNPGECRDQDLVEG
jgi:hypothetical protein